MSIASPPIFSKTVLLIKPLEKSESKPSDKEFIICELFNLNFEFIIFIASSHLLLSITELEISTSDL